MRLGEVSKLFLSGFGFLCFGALRKKSKATTTTVRFHGRRMRMWDVGSVFTSPDGRMGRVHVRQNFLLSVSNVSVSMRAPHFEDCLCAGRIRETLFVYGLFGLPGFGLSGLFNGN